MISCTKKHFSDGKDPVLPQHWTIIIDAVTTLKQRWPSSRIASRILSLGLMFPGQTVPSDCRRFAFSFDVRAWVVSRVSRWSGVPNRSTQPHIWQGVVGNTPHNDRMDMECYRYTSYSGTHCTERKDIFSAVIMAVLHPTSSADPDQHETLTQCWFNAGTVSRTLGLH